MHMLKSAAYCLDQQCCMCSQDTSTAFSLLPFPIAAGAIHLLIKNYKMYHLAMATANPSVKHSDYNADELKFINDNKKLIHLVVRYRCVCLCVCCLPHFSRLRPSSRSPSANLKRWLYFFVSPEIKWIFFRWSDLLHFEFPFYRLHSE